MFLSKIVLRLKRGKRLKNYENTFRKSDQLEKLNLISKSKITIVHNLTGNYTPQLKSRPFEAALCKSLILCKKDDWNFIEEWFVEGEDFLYYNDSNDLKLLIDNILNNYDSYSNMIENSYNKAINNYTTRKFVEKYFIKNYE